MVGRRRNGGDDGLGSLDDYDYDLRPLKTSIVLRLAGSDEYYDVLAAVIDGDVDGGIGEVWAMISRRTPEEERTDAPMPVRLMAGGRVSTVVGIVPRGLEAPVDTALGRLTDAGKPPRVSASLVRVKSRLRVELAIGLTR